MEVLNALKDNAMTFESLIFSLILASPPLFSAMIHPQYYPYFGSKKNTEMSWQQVLAEITSTTNRVYHNTTASRAARARGDDKLAAKLKSECGILTPCCRCEGDRKSQNLTALTLVGMADIDHIPADQMAEALARVKADSHTLLCHVTNSQEGIRVLYRYDVISPDGEVLPESHFVYQQEGEETHEAYVQRMAPYYRTAWEVGTRYYAQLTGFPTDKSCKDMVRISFLCHDPEAMLRLDAEPLLITPEALLPYAENPRQPSATDAAHAAPVRKDEVLRERILDGFTLRVDEGLITRLIDDNGYTAGCRHLFWLKLGFRLKFFRHSIYEAEAYKQAALRLLSARGLVLADDPSQRLPHEVEDAMQYGFEHGTEGNDGWIAEYQQKFRAEGSAPGAGGKDSGEAVESRDLTDEDLIEQQCPLFPDTVYRNLPDQLWTALTPVADAVRQAEVPRRRMDMLLMACLVNYSALCAETEIPYGTHSYSPNIAFTGISQAGNGKGEMQYAFRIVERVDAHLEQVSHEAHRQWQEQYDAFQLAMQDKKLSREEKEALDRPGAEPQERLLVMPGTTSRSQFTLCMNAMGRDGLIINSTEIQTITATLKLDVGDFSDLLCKAMANERIDQFFKCDTQRIKIDRPKLSVCLSGTFDQFHQFIPDYENGLYSRFAFMMMEPHIKWISQQPSQEHDKYEALYAGLSDDAFQMWQMLQQCPTRVLFTAGQWQRHSLQWGEELDSLVLEGGQDRLSVVTRHGLLHMRIAAVLTVLRKWNEYLRAAAAVNPRNDHERERMTELFGREHRDVVCRDDDFLTALSMACTLLAHALHLSTTIVQHQNRNVQPMQQWPWAVRCAAEMHETFASSDFVERADKAYGRSRAHSYRSLRALVSKGYLVKREHGGYVKCEALQKVATPPK